MLGQLKGEVWKNSSIECEKKLIGSRMTMGRDSHQQQRELNKEDWHSVRDTTMIFAIETRSMPWRNRSYFAFSDVEETTTS